MATAKQTDVFTPVKKSEIASIQKQLRDHFESGFLIQPKNYALGHKGFKGPMRLWVGSRIWFTYRHDTAAAIHRHWNAYGMAQDLRSSLSNSIVVEINVPLDGKDRRVGGIFARNKIGKIAVLHRGSVGGGKPGVGKTAFLKWYKKRHGEAFTTVKWPADKSGVRRAATEQVILIGYLGDKGFQDDVEEFVGEVKKFKAHVDRMNLRAQAAGQR